MRRINNTDMTNIIIILLGLVLFIDAIMDKFHLWHVIETTGANQRHRFLYLLTQCRFCMLFWMTVAIWWLAFMLYFIDAGTWPAIFIISGLTTIKHRAA